ncbi:guanylate kinase [Helicobacter kayseriensis]|uniref:guanylate kinase n=1 Tax=Helicobacter kayseriensis TaxID=2905877 RepID=UPI001E3B8B88|nr:guanylate kinase [Helicobacter kayseriensis]MCE3047667.1 guanylate kinase [Helicobacter kayseriensis]MCE3049095.1 guanylate kinase [Helicobacter kayseriensis]
MSILILSGPSGSGKSTLCSAIMKKIPNVYFSISSTTRKPREGEKNGREYHFLSQEEFLKDIEEGNFLEWAQVHSNYYGTSLKPVEEAIDEGKIVVFDVDVQGHHNIKKYYGKLATSVFVTTPSKSVLAERLKGRRTDNEEVIEMRLMHAYNEMKHIDEFDFLIVNDEIQTATEAILSIVQSLRYAQRLEDTQKLLNEWLG